MITLGIEKKPDIVRLSSFALSRAQPAGASLCGKGSLSSAAGVSG